MMKKVLVFYRDFKPIIKGFESLGYDVVSFKNLPNLSEVISLKEPQVALFDMYDIVKKPLQAYMLRKKLNELNCPIIVWNRDGPSNKGEKAWRQFFLKNLPLFNIYASHTLQVMGKINKEVFYLANAADTSNYYKADNQSDYVYDVGFIGAIDANKYPDMKKRVVFLSKLAVFLKNLNISYHFSGEKVSPSEQRDLIKKTKINLQYHAGCDTRFRNHQRFERSWGLPERCYGIPACGGFLLSDERRHGVDDFGEDWCFFEDNIDDCVAKIRFYLDNFDLTRQIAERQHQRVMQQHTYEHRAKQLLAFADEWRASR
jgi:spore maturation protein CgeB